MPDRSGRSRGGIGADAGWTGGRALQTKAKRLRLLFYRSRVARTSRIAGDAALDLMLPAPHISEIAHVIQIAVAPVFLLTGVAATISALTARIGRIIDRARLLEAEHSGYSGLRQEEVHRELGRLARRARLVNVALTLCTLTALLVTVLIGLAFVGAYLNVELSVAVGILFVLAMVIYSAGLLAFLTEVWLATRHLRIGFLQDGPEGEAR